MNRKRLIDLDQFLAVAEITGERFGLYWLTNCGLGRWAQSRGLFAGFDVDQFLGMGYVLIERALETGAFRLAPLWEANDANEGDPAAVRTALHREFPEVFTAALREVA